MPLRRRLRYAAALVVIFVLVITGCSGSSGPSPSPVTLAGTYQALSDGPYLQISFIDGEHYSLLRSNCGGDGDGDGDEGCEVNGTYAFDANGDMLSLVDDATGETTELPFSASTGASTLNEPLRVENDGTSLGASGATSLVNGTTPISGFQAGTQLFKVVGPLTATWTTLSTGIALTKAQGNNVLITFGGYTATEEDSRTWALALASTPSVAALGFGTIYASRGPARASQIDSQLVTANRQLATALAAQVANADLIVVVAHSSGAMVAQQLLGFASSDVLKKTAYFALDGGGPPSSHEISEMKAVTFVYANDPAAGNSENAGAMISAHATSSASHLFKVDATGSKCNRNAGWCLHDTLITSQPHNPAHFNIALDYRDFTGGRHVVTSYLEEAIASKWIAP
jgi:hypothetical protein